MKALAFRTSVPVAGAVLLLGLYAYYGLVIYRDYFLQGDDPPFVSASLQSPGLWFTRGYLDYFRVYPEWGTLYTTPFLRPIDSVLGYLNHTLFGRTYALHFATFFLAQFLSLLIFTRLLRVLSVAPIAAAGMALLFLFNPAFMNVGLVCLPCQFDVWAGLFALGAFLSLWREGYGLALLLLTLAIFTKESALFAPLAASLSLLIWRRSPVMATLMVVPLLAWAGARLLVYGDIFVAGVPGSSAQVAVGATIWPTGLVPFGFVEQAPLALPITRSEALSAFFLIANIGLWMFLGYAALIAARRYIESPDFAGPTTALFVWMAGALSFGVLVGYNPRYGGSYYPFLYLFLAALLFSPAYRAPRWVSASVLFVFSAATLVQSARTVRDAVLWDSAVAPERALYDTLRALPQDGETVYVVNAPDDMAAAPRHLTAAWGLSLNVVIVNQFRGCEKTADGGTTELLPSGAGLVRVHIPDCAAYTFGPATPTVLDEGVGVVLRRDGVATYRFPEGQVTANPYFPDWGRTMAFQIDAKADEFVVIGYDWQSVRYALVARRSDVSG